MAKLRRSARIAAAKLDKCSLPGKAVRKAKASRALKKPLAGRKTATHRQSPIDIVPGAVCHDPDLCKVDTLNISYKPGDCCDVIVNAGGFRVNVERGCSTTLTGNHLGDATYELAQFHAHWGTNGQKGSEHLLNGKSMSGEVHFVFWNTNYGSFCEALNKEDGLAVVGVFLKEGQHNDDYHSLIETIRKAAGGDKPFAMPKDFDLIKLLPSPDDRDFVTYAGSLTTPPFSECVIWTVFTTPVEISYGQLNVLRNIVAENHRECQDLCGRQIRSSITFA
ncbi:unnamed protein product [Caenorhabditis auriculariae]|uniref:Alpha-carbonic anhydrase domain-containing protein n=1 Tax=Caenorhabditis auriculariae TaxID=2777116 RepID=A0A8S1H6H5_9PELO|nr:unnamed protein product [Caenorhabditis auriculariae]